MLTTAISPYPWRRVPRLAMRVRYGQAELAHRELDVLLDEFDQEHDKALGPRKLRCGMVMSYCLRGARLGGAPSEAILDRMMAAIGALARQRSWPAVRRFMHRFLEQMMENVAPRRQNPLVRLIGRMQRELLGDPGSAVSLKAYAASAGLHPDRLSREFHRIVGHTFGEMRRQGRIARAQQRLLGSNASVAKIARSLGVHDVSRFIKEFKRETGQTPRKFRAG